MTDSKPVDQGSIPWGYAKFQGDATVVTARAGEDKKPKYADELA